ncbi:hypothetical protein AHAS_Ahas13G0024300 [Arachis hypogaea]
MAQESEKALVSLINEVLDQAKIEVSKLELEDSLFVLRAVLDDILSLFSKKSQEKGIEVIHILYAMFYHIRNFAIYSDIDLIHIYIYLHSWQLMYQMRFLSC